jgi:Carboxypeptidase regulatory-like domain
MKRCAILLFGFSLIIPVVVFGQSDRGAIAGTVSDPAGAMVAKATVQAKSVETGNVYKAVSLGTGKYTLADLPAGQYEISVAVPGLRAYEQKNVRVQAAKESPVDIHLQEGTQLSSLGEDTLAIAADMRRHAPPSGPTPRTADGKPDLSGVWWTPQVTDPGKPEWLPFAEKIARQNADNNRKDSPQGRCLPSPVVRLGPLYEFVQSKAVLALISDDDTPGFRQIYLDGRGHPAEPDPAWYGHAIGRWEGVWPTLAGHPLDGLHLGPVRPA